MSAAPWTSPLGVGEPVPWFAAATPTSELFHFSTTVGRYMLLGFLPPPGAARDAALAAIAAHRAAFDDDTLAAFLILRDAPSIAAARNQPPGLRWFFDADGTVSSLYGALDAKGAEHPHWVLIDPAHRVLSIFPIADTTGLFAEIEVLPAVADHAGAELFAPVLIVPRIFDGELCRRLIEIYDADGGAPSGVMRDVGGKTVGFLDDFKRRRDVTVADPALQGEIRSHLARRLAPQIARVFQFEATRVERYIVACYDAADGGYFKAHRDNETLGTAHRRFAVSINLNAEEFEGGDLRFPEFGPRLYRPPTGGAVVFSCSLQHEAMPVTRGRRYAYLPFLYDDDAAKIREANRDKFAEP